MSKLNQWLTLVANVSVVAGIIFLGFELQQNTQAIQGQTRDSITEKQMLFSEWIATNPATSEVFVRGNEGLEGLSPGERQMYVLLVNGHLREWENSMYQYQQGLFTAEDFEPRVATWRDIVGLFPGYRETWSLVGHRFAPSFRAEIDRIVAEVEGAR